ncbi:hypothetical protein [Gloeothece verrucosa]|uniref:Uncharacterized protein n=1 Tax=Gloeothece verrucosa (strain PCC 7822) TaxID=497965 RepID=E0U8E2_GLOV7|nr:hypothetical protein [Gloeothece verrucosa]ADN12578.1 conserved hypothetical protein [Gloeothece verrucosa PCC 7822]
MQSHSFWGFMLLIFTASGCSSQPSTDKFVQEMKTVTSWAATSQMVGDAWLKQDVPTVYAKLTLETAQEKLQKEAETLNKVTPFQQKTRVLNQLQQLEKTVTRMAIAVNNKDNPAVSQQVQILSTHQQALHSLIKETGGQP